MKQIPRSLLARKVPSQAAKIEARGGRVTVLLGAPRLFDPAPGHKLAAADSATGLAARPAWFPRRHLQEIRRLDFERLRELHHKL
jgi:hypothetical protein